DTLNRGRARADDADDLVLQARQVPVRIAAGVAVVPARGVERMALEAFHAGNARQLRPVQRARRERHEARTDGIAAVRLDDPARGLLVPLHGRDLGLEQRVLVETEFLADGARVFQNFGRARVFLDRHGADLFEQRQIDVAFDIAGRARIAV